jgi:hypothetical protein
VHGTIANEPGFMNVNIFKGSEFDKIFKSRWESPIDAFERERVRMADSVVLIDELDLSRHLNASDLESIDSSAVDEGISYSNDIFN